MSKVLASLVATAAVLAALTGTALADAPGTAATTPLDEDASVKKSTISLTIPEDNELVWGYVRGAPMDLVGSHPVIVQFFQDGEVVHVAQVEAEEDGSFEYRFRVKSTDLATGEVSNIFQGDYTIKIFRVVPNTDGRA